MFEIKHEEFHNIITRAIHEAGIPAKAAQKLLRLGRGVYTTGSFRACPLTKARLATSTGSVSKLTKEQRGLFTDYFDLEISYLIGSYDEEFKVV